MDQAQILRQIEYKLATGVTEFGRVTIGEDTDHLGGRPECLIVDSGYEAHDEWSSIGWLYFTVRIVTASMRGRRGREGVIGDNLQKVLQRKVLEVLDLLQAPDGIIHLEHPNAFSPVTKGYRGNGSVFTSEISCEAFIGNDANDYPDAKAFAASGGGGFPVASHGTIDLTFTNPDTRWDRVGVHIRYQTGSRPLTTASGTLAYEGPTSPQQVTGLTPGTTYYFSCWGAYDADWNGDPGSTPTAGDTYSSTALSGAAVAKFGA